MDLGNIMVNHLNLMLLQKGLLILLTVPSCVGQTLYNVNKWMKDYLDPINPHIRPVVNQSETIVVSMSFHLVVISDFDEVSESLYTTGWLNVRWLNQNLRWKKEDYGGLGDVSVPPEKIWTPVIAVSNSINELRPLDNRFLYPKVTSEGLTTWRPGSGFRTSCKMDLASFPFDVQICDIEFFVWGQEITKVDLRAIVDRVDLDTFKENAEWKLVSSSLERRIMNPEGSPHPMLVVTLHLRRRATVFIQSVIIPLVILANMNVLVFLIPAETGEKISFSVTVLLAFGVFLGFINGRMPQTSETTSSLSVYMSFLLALSFLFVLMSILIANVCNKSASEVIPPGFVKFSKAITKWCAIRRKLSRNERVDNNNVNSDQCAVDSISTTDVITWKSVSGAIDRFVFIIFFPPIFLTSFTLLMLPSIKSYLDGDG